MSPLSGSPVKTMKFYDFEIIIEKEPEDAGYFAYSPSLPGCFSNGLTIEETRRNIREAIQLHISQGNSVKPLLALPAQ